MLAIIGLILLVTLVISVVGLVLDRENVTFQSGDNLSGRV